MMVNIPLYKRTLHGSAPAMDIPRFPERNDTGLSRNQPPRKRLGLYRRQMRDTIVATTEDEKIHISLSSRRYRRHIAQMQTVKAGGRDATDQHTVTTGQFFREG